MYIMGKEIHITELGWCLEGEVLGQSSEKIADMYSVGIICIRNCYENHCKPQTLNK